MADTNASIINYIIQTKDYIEEFVQNELKYGMQSSIFSSI